MPTLVGGDGNDDSCRSPSLALKRPCGGRLLCPLGQGKQTCYKDDLQLSLRGQLGPPAISFLKSRGIFHLCCLWRNDALVDSSSFMLTSCLLFKEI